MFYNLESDFGNGCNTCDTVPQQPMMGTGQQPFNPYAVNTNQPAVPQPPAVPVVQTPPQQPQQVVVQQNGQTASMDSAAHQAATQYNNEPVVEAPDFVNTVEGFESMGLMTDKRKMVLCVFVILTALALNECMKYYLNKGVQACEGTSYHYLSYAFLAVLVVLVVYHLSRNMA
jgi:hypothetical protein